MTAHAPLVHKPATSWVAINWLAFAKPGPVLQVVFHVHSPVYSPVPHDKPHTSYVAYREGPLEVSFLFFVVFSPPSVLVAFPGRFFLVSTCIFLLVLEVGRPRVLMRIIIPLFGRIFDLLSRPCQGKWRGVVSDMPILVHNFFPTV